MGGIGPVLRLVGPGILVSSMLIQGVIPPGYGPLRQIKFMEPRRLRWVSREAAVHLTRRGCCVMREYLDVPQHESWRVPP